MKRFRDQAGEREGGQFSKGRGTKGLFTSRTGRGKIREGGEEQEGGGSTWSALTNKRKTGGISRGVSLPRILYGKGVKEGGAKAPVPVPKEGNGKKKGRILRVQKPFFRCAGGGGRPRTFKRS